MKVTHSAGSTPAARRPVDGAAFVADMVKNYKSLPKELQQSARTALSKFSADTMRALKDSGHQIAFCQADAGGGAGGMVNSRNNLIQLFVKPGDPHTESYMIHELVHAVDRLRFRQEKGVVDKALAGDADCFLSRQDPKLHELHLNYAKRSLPAVGRQIAEFAAKHPEAKDKTIQAGGREYNWKLQDQKLELQEHDRATRTLEATYPYLIKGGLLTAIGGAALTVAVSAGALAVGGLIAAPLLAVGVKRLAAGVRAYRDEKALDGFQNAAVQVSPGGKLTFDLEQTPEIEATTAYATLNRRPEEYLAESMTEYLRSPQTRESLKQRDPDMYEYCQAWNLQP